MTGSIHAASWIVGLLWIEVAIASFVIAPIESMVRSSGGPLRVEHFLLLRDTLLLKPQPFHANLGLQEGLGDKLRILAWQRLEETGARAHDGGGHSLVRASCLGERLARRLVIGSRELHWTCLVGCRWRRDTYSAQSLTGCDQKLQLRNQTRI